MVPFMNMFNMTACALGNHEFDDSPDGLLPLATKAQFPIVCANCDFSEIPEFHGLVKPYHLVEVDGRKIGIIGYLTTDTKAQAVITNTKKQSVKLKNIWCDSKIASSYKFATFFLPYGQFLTASPRIQSVCFLKCSSGLNCEPKPCSTTASKLHMAA